MKRIATMIAVILAMLALTLSVGATESETLATAESTTPVTEAPAITEAPVTEAPAITEAPEITEAPIIEAEPEEEVEDIFTIPDTSAPDLAVPDKESLTDSIVGWLDKLDEDLSGIELWETAKAWILANLDTVVGAILVVTTTIVGLATKFSFVPKIIKKVQLLFNAIGTWYDENTAAIKDIIEKFSEFCTDMTVIIKKVEKQSEENLELRQRLVEVETDYINAKNENTRVLGLLLGYTKLSAEEFQALVQTSDLTKAEVDQHYEAYKQKIALIEEASEGSDE